MRPHRPFGIDVALPLRDRHGDGLIVQLTDGVEGRRDQHPFDRLGRDLVFGDVGGVGPQRDIAAQNTLEQVIGREVEA